MILADKLHAMQIAADDLRNAETEYKKAARLSFRAYRLATGVTVTGLAVRLNVTTKYVEDVEAGLLVPSEAVAQRLVSLATRDGIEL